MREGASKLLAACSRREQALEASKSLLTCNARILALLSQLQRMRKAQILQRVGHRSEGVQGYTVCKETENRSIISGETYKAMIYNCTAEWKQVVCGHVSYQPLEARQASFFSPWGVLFRCVSLPDCVYYAVCVKHYIQYMHEVHRLCM